MPNWCDNYLTITANTNEQIQDIRKKLGEDRFTFNKVYPTPDILLKIDDAVSKAWSTSRNTSRCWSTLCNLNITTDQTLGFMNILKDGMVTTRKNQIIPLTEFVEQEYAKVPSDVRQQFLKELGEVTGKQTVTLAEAVTHCLEVGEGFTFSSDWQKERWGTKWDIEPTPLEDLSDKSLSVFFETAWTPPVEFLEHLSEMLPEAKFELTYCEPGNDVWGKMSIQNGSSSEVDVDKKEIMEFFGFDDEDDEEEGDIRPVV